jgi:oligopeptide transport system substrate-binding protein
MKSKRMLSLMLACAMTFGLAACGGNGNNGTTNSDSTGAANESAAVNTDETTATGGTVDDSADYDTVSSQVYDLTLGDFYDIYKQTENIENISEKFAMQAVSEAKLMESAVILPATSGKGMYAMSRVAPYTYDYTLWGTDYSRYHQALVATDMIKAEDRAEMKAKWSELKGTGEYEQWAKDYLKEKGYTLKDSLTLGYASDPTTWDEFATYLASDSDAIVNTYDGLVEYDTEGTIQPALAESWEVSEDGLTYTFHLRKGVEWVDSQGRAIAEVKADDFVAGMQHLLDCQAGQEYLLEGVIVNASQYINGEVTDIADVGIKAVDDYTVEYTLEQPVTYFTTMLGYSDFAPLCRSYYTSQGGKFGAEFDASASDYTFGKDPNSIAYCGPYIVSNATASNTIVFKENESYWNKDNINVKTITWLFNDGSDATKAYNDLKAGTLDSVNLTTAAIELAKKSGELDEYGFITDTDATTYTFFYNMNRAAFANFNDDTKVVSSQTDEDKERTKQAMRNVHFRRALSFAVDRATYNAQAVGEDLKYASLRNTYTPANFVQLEEDTTISINGTDTTFAAGTYYGEIVQAQLDADNFPVKVWDKEANDGIGSGDGFDGWYNPDNAVEELNTAIEELSALGITIDEDNPIQIDIPYPSIAEIYTNKVNAYKQSLEKVLGGKVQVNLIDGVDYNGWYYAGYYATYGYENNYDVYDLSGWSPDFGDPCTFLDTFLPDYAGYQTKSLGIY